MTRAKPNGRGFNSGVAFQPVERVVFSADDAAAYLGLGSARAMQRLVDADLLAPFSFGKSHSFHRDELNRFLQLELERERAAKGLDP